MLIVVSVSPPFLYVFFCRWSVAGGLSPRVARWVSMLRSLQRALPGGGRWLMGYWETRLSRDEAGRRAVANCMYMCTDRATVIVVSPCHCMIDLVKRVRQGACM